MKGNRGQRLSSQFREEIYNVISHDVRNRYPELSAIISITDVDVAPDLKTAKVYVSIFDTDTEKKRTSFGILRTNAGYIRHALAQILRLRTVPELSFVLDDSMEYGEKIDRLLKNIETKESDEDEK